MSKKSMLAMLLVSAAGLSSSAIWADEDEDKSAVANLLPTSKTTLQQGLTISESQGQPISAKFEAEEGHFQLSVYTAKAGKFYEVAIDPATGKVAKTEQITEGEDLANAKSQATAMAKTKASLKAAVEKAEHDQAGARAVSVTPKLKQDHATADVTLLKGKQFKSVTESLE